MKKIAFILLMLAATVTAVAKPPILEPREAPSPLNVTERSASDILFYPYTFMPYDINTKERALPYLETAFGEYEIVNGGIGYHRSDVFSYTFLGRPIEICYVDWYDNRHYYYFVFDTYAEAATFAAEAAKALTAEGLPLKPDKTYGGVSNRNKPIGIFKWVYVSDPVKVNANQVTDTLYTTDYVGKYVVDIGIYKR